ncbi:hypothetical protein [Sorangium sp. So ce426]|uniref:hypothetical protein n=1 Tax=unclassified Sorangium TaxID=2621164 RepID=UPI003F5AED5B
MTIVGVLAAGLALMACGDGGDAGDDGEDGDETAIALDENQRIGELTAREAGQVCDDLAEPMKLAKVDQCDLVGLLFSPEEGECVLAWRKCLATAGEPLTSSRCNTSEFKWCTATVAEVKACMIAATEAMKALSCGSDIDLLQSPVDLLQSPEECAGVSEKCPWLLKDVVGF